MALTKPKRWMHPACVGCPYRNRSLGYVEGVGLKTADLLIFSEAPGRRELAAGIPFFGPSGTMLNVRLSEVGLTRREARIDNACRCVPLVYIKCDCNGKDPCCPQCGATGKYEKLNGRKDYVLGTPSPEQVKECMARHRQLDGLSPKVTLALGSAALYGLTGEVEIRRWRGLSLCSPLVPGKVVATYHPAYVLRMRSFEPVSKQDFELARRLLQDSPVAAPQVDYAPLPIEKLRAAERLVLDLETTGGEPLPVPGSRITEAAASVRPYQGSPVPVGELGRLLNGRESVIGQNFLYDARWLAAAGIPVPKRIVDTMLLGHVLNPSTPNDLTFLQSMYAEHPIDHNWKTEKAYRDERQLVALKDVDATHRLLEGGLKQLEREGRVGLFWKNVVPLTRIGFEMQQVGVRIDSTLMQQEIERLHAEARSKAAELAPVLGVPRKSKTGLPSPNRLRDWLYQEMGIRPRRVQNRLSVSGEKINDILMDPETPESVREVVRSWKEARELSGQAINYAKFLAGSRVHAELVIGRREEGDGAARTGRLAYRDPSLHQVPRYVRRAFLPDEGKVFVEVDMRQIELFLAVREFRQADLLQQMCRGLDLHEHTRAALGLDRRAAKVFNFALIYGGGVPHIAATLGLRQPAAQAMYDRVLALFPGRAEYVRRVTEFVRRHGYYQTEFGWRTYFDDLTNEPAIINMPIQSNAALIGRKALVECWGLMESDWRIVLTVHDSILFEVPPEDVARLQRTVRPALEQPLDELDGFRPQWDWKVGSNWCDLNAPGY